MRAFAVERRPPLGRAGSGDLRRRPTQHRWRAQGRAYEISQAFQLSAQLPRFFPRQLRRRCAIDGVLFRYERSRFRLVRQRDRRLSAQRYPNPFLTMRTMTRLLCYLRLRTRADDESRWRMVTQRDVDSSAAVWALHQRNRGEHGGWGVLDRIHGGQCRPLSYWSKRVCLYW